MLVTVRRPFYHKGKLLAAGTVVNAQGWRNLQKMLDQRLVLPGGDLGRDMTPPLKPEKVKEPKER